MARPDSSGGRLAAGTDSSEPVFDTHVGRRRFLAIGGGTLAAAAVLAACAESDPGGIARVGVAPSTSALPDAIVNDVVLLRTASSLEHTIAGAYEWAMAQSGLLPADLADAAKRMRDDHVAAAKTFEGLTSDAGGEPWTCGNPRYDEVVLTPIERSIIGGPATETLAAVDPSDDPTRDAMNFLHAMETIAAATYQGMMVALTTSELRQEAITVGVTAARHAAVLAIAITGRPAGYANPADVENATLETTTTAAPTTTQNIASPDSATPDTAAADSTPIPPVYAMPGTFGRLGVTQLVAGRPNAAGTRVTYNLETPSLNSFVYEYMTPSC